MKKTIVVLISSLIFFLTGCEKENIKPLSINIETGKSEYIGSSLIDVTIKNNLNQQASHFKCDNDDLCPSKILKNENDTWVEYGYPVACTQMGTAEYFGILKIAETKHDTLSLTDEFGQFKLRYRFIVANDTLDFDSNAFIVHGLEL